MLRHVCLTFHPFQSVELDSTPLSVRKLKVLVLGAPRVGKSGIVRRWLHNSFDSNIDSYIPTAKVDLSNKMMQVSDKVVQLEVWDTPSHPDIRDV
jgi:GTPase SAR1 family protein